MSVIFSVRSDSFTPRYCLGDSSYVLSGDTAITIDNDGDAGIIGGKIFNYNTDANPKSLIYAGNSNFCPTINQFSILIRVKSLGATIPANTSPLACFASGVITTDYRGRFNYQLAADGKIYSNVYNNDNLVAFNLGSGVLAVEGTGKVSDIVMTVDFAEATRVNVIKFYLDGVLISQHNSSRVSTDVFRQDGVMVFGHSYFNINEIVLWDEIIDPTPSGLSLIGSDRTEFVTVESKQADVCTDPAIENVKLGTEYTFEGTSLTGTYDLGVYTDPAIENVRLGTDYTFNSSTLTGTLAVPSANTGPAGTLQLNQIKENIRYILDTANTTTAEPVYLSEGLKTRNKVKKVLKYNPELIPTQPDYYPFVTVYIDSKSMESATIAKNQLTGKRKANISINIAAAIWDQNYVNEKSDPPENELEYLMENIELILRAYPNLGGEVAWQEATDISYQTVPWDEQTHLRGAILKIDAKVWY